MTFSKFRKLNLKVEIIAKRQIIYTSLFSRPRAAKIDNNRINEDVWTMSWILKLNVQLFYR